MIRFAGFVAAILLPLCLPAADEFDPSARRIAAESDYGPALCHSLTFVKPKDHNARTWEGAILRGMVIGLPSERMISYDLRSLAVAATWRGQLDLSKTHYRRSKGTLPARPSSTPTYLDLDTPGWVVATGRESAPRLAGYYYHGRDVVIEFDFAGRRVLEQVVAVGSSGYARHVSSAPGGRAVRALVAARAGATILGRTAMWNEGSRGAAVISGAESVTLHRDDRGLWAAIPASKEPLRLEIRFDPENSDASALAKPESAAVDLSAKTKGGAARWTTPITSQGTLGPDDRAYTVDEFEVPSRPFGAWMRLSAIDFFENGNIAVSTFNGDVWIVSWEKEDLSAVTWRRFATGLYEPLGLRVVDEKVY
ncbi:MAG: hypothetical protein AAF488_10740, partial [Planctomycetota bacterium]